MMPNTDPLAELYDIEGLDAISWWPLAIGWWVVLTVVLTLASAIIIFYWRKHAFERSWRNSTLKALSKMERHTASQDTAIALSEIIRRITIHTHSRKECAGLEGKVWLRWLKEHDPEKFDWEEKAAWLVNIPYAPVGTSIPESEIKTTIQAIRRWIR